MVVWILPIRELEATLHRHGAVAGVLRAAGAELRFRSLGGALLPSGPRGIGGAILVNQRSYQT